MKKSTHASNEKKVHEKKVHATKVEEPETQESAEQPENEQEEFPQDQPPTIPAEAKPVQVENYQEGLDAEFKSKLMAAYPQLTDADFNFQGEKLFTHLQSILGVSRQQIHQAVQA